MSHPRTPDGRLRRLWPSLRALLVGLHLVLIVLLSFPAAPGRERFERPRTQREITLWADRLSVFGLEVTSQRLSHGLWRVAERYAEVRHALDHAAAPYVDVAGTRQSWGMFRSPQREPAILVVAIDRGRGFEPIYESRSPRWRWRADTLDQHRFRKRVGQAGRSSELFEQLARWLGDCALADHPDARRARVRLDRFHSPPPGPRPEGDTPGRHPVRSLVISRGGS